MTLKTILVECKRCGARYNIVPGVPATAPHGPNKDCPSNCWKVISSDDA